MLTSSRFLILVLAGIISIGFLTYSEGQTQANNKNRKKNVNAERDKYYAKQAKNKNKELAYPYNRDRYLKNVTNLNSTKPKGNSSFSSRGNQTGRFFLGLFFKPPPTNPPPPVLHPQPQQYPVTPSPIIYTTTPPAPIPPPISPELQQSPLFMPTTAAPIIPSMSPVFATPPTQQRPVFTTTAQITTEPPMTTTAECPPDDTPTEAITFPDSTIPPTVAAPPSVVAPPPDATLPSTTPSPVTEESSSAPPKKKKKKGEGKTTTPPSSMDTSLNRIPTATDCPNRGNYPHFNQKCNQYFKCKKKLDTPVNSKCEEGSYFDVFTGYCGPSADPKGCKLCMFKTGEKLIHPDAEGNPRTYICNQYNLAKQE